MPYNTGDHEREFFDDAASMLGDKCLIVHSRDNSIKLLKRKKTDVGGTMSGLRESRWMIFNRFIGSRVERFNVKCCVSPDSKYLLTGSEDGKIFMWDVPIEVRQNTDHLGIENIKFITQCEWNKRMHMVAVCSWGKCYPIVIY